MYQLFRLGNFIKNYAFKKLPIKRRISIELSELVEKIKLLDKALDTYNLPNNQRAICNQQILFMSKYAASLSQRLEKIK